MFQGLALTKILFLFGLFGNPAQSEAQPLRQPSRGELLYSTHCIACHSTQVHWREKKLVTDWESLQSEVQRWHETLMLEWDKNDNKEVAQYLNTLYYHYNRPD